MWGLCEIAICACDLAEVIGSAIALNLLFKIPLVWGVCLTALDVLAVMYLQNKGFRYIEALVITLIIIIGGCFAFWAWLRMGKTPVWTIPGVVSLILFAMALTRIDAPNAGRAYAAYGGIYILSSLLWLWGIESVRPDRWDITGAAICLIGAGVILVGPRG